MAAALLCAGYGRNVTRRVSLTDDRLASHRNCFHITEHGIVFQPEMAGDIKGERWSLPDCRTSVIDQSYSARIGVFWPPGVAFQTRVNGASASPSIAEMSLAGEGSPRIVNAGRHAERETPPGGGLNAARGARAAPALRGVCRCLLFCVLLSLRCLWWR